LHGDEAWLGMRALEIGDRGFFSVNGMTAYTGALFPQIIAASFSTIEPGVFALRLPGAIFNWLAVAIVWATFRNRGYAGFYSTLLFASSLLFLFYSRVAWEVSALQNLLLALIVWTLSEMFPVAETLSAAENRGGHRLLFFLACTLGAWNHFIFLAATLSFGIAATYIALSHPGKESARLFLLAAFNAPLQCAVLIGKPLLSEGAFSTHALPAILIGLAIVGATSDASIRAEKRALPWIMAFPTRSPELADSLRNFLIYGTAAVFMLTLRYDATSFFGTVSGYIMMERVVSYVPSPVEATALYVRMAVVVAAYALLVFRQLRRSEGRQHDALKCLLLLWPIGFLVVLQNAAPGLSDRYFIIPQFLLFCAIAVSIGDLGLGWRRVVQAVLVLGFVFTQTFLWREFAYAENRPPLDFRYGSYSETSRHFMKLDSVEAFVRDAGFCQLKSKSFFIEEPLLFMRAVRPPSCWVTDTVHVDYCDSCRKPIAWFSVTVPRIPNAP